MLSQRLPKNHLLLVIWLLLSLPAVAWAEKEGVIVNGDKVEYSADSKEITATGNVEVLIKGARITCDRIVVNSETKDIQAEGHVRFVDKGTVVEGDKVIYNFQDKTGVIIDANFRSNPYFAKTKEMQKVSEEEFVCLGGYATTCSLDRPHYRIKSKKINFFPGNKIQTKEDIFYLGNAPLAYLPEYNHSLRDPLMHVQVTPGKSKDWGYYLLSLYHYDLKENVTARIYADYRNNLGLAEGFGFNYKTQKFGKGDFKFYYTHERDKNQPEGTTDKFERYLARWRHNWSIDSATRLITEYYKIKDTKMQLGTANTFLKDYFYREFEKDSQPKTYLLLSHNFNYSSVNLLVQKRINRWYDHTANTPDEKLPEILYTLPEYELGESPFYFKTDTSFANLANKYPAGIGITTTQPPDQQVTRFDTYNQFSMPFKFFFIFVNPFVGSRETYYSRDIDGGSINPRTIFYSGTDLSTKFYRLFNVKSNFLGMDINGLRHIITPTVKFGYNHEPTVHQSQLQIFDDIDSISASNTATIELVNKIQTKRRGKGIKGELERVDFAMLKLDTDYNFEPKGTNQSGLTDFLFDLELLPYSWLRMKTDGTYGRKERVFKEINFSSFMEWDKGRNFGLGYRYERKGGKEITTQFNWRLNPKWRFGIYERYQIAEVRKKGMKEQEYTIGRNLHCWDMDFTYNISSEHGHTLWLIFRLRAFPELEFNFDQNYHAPKDGSQQS